MKTTFPEYNEHNNAGARDFAVLYSSNAFQFAGFLRRWLPFILFSAVLCVNAAPPLSKAQEEKLADAIYIAEGGDKTRHPYGILKKFKTTTPRQACINTIRSNRKRWDGKGDFVEALGRVYCPVGAANDPTGLNKNWVKNVKANWRYEN